MFDKLIFLKNNILTPPYNYTKKTNSKLYKVNKLKQNKF